MKLSAAALLTIPLTRAGFTKTILATDDAPAAIGPYSQGVVVSDENGNGMIYVAGQIGLTAGEGGDLVPGGVKAETVQLMENIKSILAKGATEMTNIVECTVLMADLTNEYADFNSIYATYFDDAPPVRAAFEVVKLPKDARAEVKCSAMI